jgi:polyisoprenoid-binding protein YceI
VGVTSAINGEIRVDRANPQNSQVGTITVDISAFTSDSERRDQAIRDRWLESARFPVVTFVPTSIEGLPASYTDGETLTIQVTGDMTVRETTRPATFEVTGQIQGDRMTGTATTGFNMSDFGFPAPDIAGMLKAEDAVKATLNFVAQRQG